MSEIGCAGESLGVWGCHCGLGRQPEVSIKVRGGGLLGCDLRVDLVGI